MPFGGLSLHLPSYQVPAITLSPGPFLGVSLISNSSADHPVDKNLALCTLYPLNHLTYNLVHQKCSTNNGFN